LGEFMSDVDDLANGHQLAADGDLQRLALHVLHDNECPTVGVGDFVDFADVRMVERRGGERFAPRALARDEVLFVVGMEPLDATRRSSRRSWARNTSPIPSARSGESMRYRPASRSIVGARVSGD
jgi:hypothetical protein